MTHKHIILFTRSLDYGGAERQLVELAIGLHDIGVRVTVLTFYPGGNLLPELANVGIQVENLDKKGRWDVIPFLFRLCTFVRKERAQAIYAFLGVPSIMALLARFARPGLRVVWGVRSADMDLSRYDWLSRFSYRLESFCSRFADLIIVNSNAGRTYAISKGFPSQSTIVIPNGINVDYFKPCTLSREKLRKEWAVPEHELLFGLVGRLDPMKDHPLFFRAAVELRRQDIPIRFVCVGDGPEPYKSELIAAADQLGLNDLLIWAGARKDMPAVYSALDVLVLSSCTEGFPNVVAEAMACGTPSVVTDVGDSAFIVGNTGFVVPPGQPVRLADAMLLMFRSVIQNRDYMKEDARMRIVNNFGTKVMVKTTLDRISELV